MINLLLEQWLNRSHRGKAVLCSVIEWKGSVPRKDYPMMLVLEDGSILGTIGGGSMELKISQAALGMIDNSRPQIFKFDMTGKDVHADIGLCGGTVTVLVEPFSLTIQNFYAEMLVRQIENPKLMVKLTLGNSDQTIVHREILTSRQSIHDTNPELQAKIQTIFENQKTYPFELNDQRYLIWQAFNPPTIHIFGAGHVGQSVAELARFNDLDVVVYDDRLELMTAERFPYAQRVETVFPISWEAIPEIPERDFVLISSRAHKHDRQLLAGLLKKPRAYLGLVSSARKWSILSESLASEGIDADAIARVHAPVGLNINAQTVPEIGISIISEIISIYRVPSA